MVAALGDLSRDGATQHPESIETGRPSVPFESSDSSVDTDPGQELGVHEVAPGTSDLPEPVVRVAPVGFDVVEQRAFELLLPVRVWQAGGAGCEESVDDLAPDIVLLLGCRRVAYSDRHGLGVPGEPVKCVLGEFGGAVDGIHDL